MHYAKPVSSPMALSSALSQFSSDPFHDLTLYHSEVGYL